MGKSRRKITNWPKYNKALKQRGSVTFWIEDSVKSDWYNKKRSGGRGRSNRYNDVAIETCPVVQAIFSLSPRATEGFLDSIFDLIGAEIKLPITQV